MKEKRVINKTGNTIPIYLIITTDQVIRIGRVLISLVLTTSFI